MDKDQLRILLEQVQSGAVAIDAALDRMRHMPFEDLGFAKLDHHRALRHGITEVIFGKGKTADQVAGIAEKLLDWSQNLLITRTDESIASRLKIRYPARCGSGAIALCTERGTSPWCAPAPATFR